MPNRLPIAYDAPETAQPEGNKYTRAMLRHARKVAYLGRERRFEKFFMVAVLAWGGLMTYDQRNMAREMVEIAKTKPVHLVEAGENGHYRVTLVDNVIRPSDGSRLQAVEWFAIWMRRLGNDPAITSQDRVAARARLVNGAEKKWDAIIKADIKWEDGWSRDALDARTVEVEHDPKTGLRAFDVIYLEKLWKKNGKPKLDQVAESVKVIRVVTQDGPPRDGAWDGVNIVEFSEPRILPNVKDGAAPAQVSQATP